MFSRRALPRMAGLAPAVSCTVPLAVITAGSAGAAEAAVTPKLRFVSTPDNGTTIKAPVGTFLFVGLPAAAGSRWSAPRTTNRDVTVPIFTNASANGDGVGVFITATSGTSTIKAKLVCPGREQASDDEQETARDSNGRPCVRARFQVTIQS
jgi:hypothetical protein